MTASEVSRDFLISSNLSVGEINQHFVFHLLKVERRLGPNMYFVPQVSEGRLP